MLGVFFLGLIATNRVQITQFISPFGKTAAPNRTAEVFGFAPFWNLTKLKNIDFSVLGTLAYFSLPVDENGEISHDSYEWGVFAGNKMTDLFKLAKKNNVRTAVTLTQMEAPTLKAFLDNEEAWKSLAASTVLILKERGLDGVNIDFEYMGSDDHYRAQFSNFIHTYSTIVKSKKPDTYVTVSVLASSARFNKIYDVGSIARDTDGVLMMAYDFYYPGSENAGPSAPLYGYNNGKGPFWYDVSTAVADFLKVAPASKIILGIPYYGWNYPAATPKPLALNNFGAVATTNEKAQSENLIKVTPLGGWDDQAKVSWRGYWDTDGWHVVYLEDRKSLSYKYNFVKEKGLAGVGLWALGYDNNDSDLWSSLRENFLGNSRLADADNGHIN